MNNLHIRKTKIICTIGPATASLEKIVALIEAGMDVARLNFSHGDHASHKKILDFIEEACEKTGKKIGILQDLGGPKIRLGVLSEQTIKLEHGQEVILFSGEKSSDSKIPVNYPYLAEDVSEGSKILLADGFVELLVERIEGGKLYCRVLSGGELSSHKGVNLPLTKLRIEAFTEKDRKDLEFGLAHDFDFVAMSFVRSAKDLAPAREMLDEHDDPPMLLAKIEKPEAIDRLDEIVELADGIMVARGDLGVEMPYEKLPIIQKHIISAARRAVVPVITATQMLRSMIDNPRPTRAEAADCANAVLDGTGAVMLSDETAVGSYPVEAVITLDQIARATEPYIDSEKYLNEPETDFSYKDASSIGRAACNLANELGAKCIVTVTHSGTTSRLVSRFRTNNLILGFTSNEKTFRRLSLYWGVVPVVTPPDRTPLQLGELAIEYVLEHKLAKSGDKIILTSGYPSSEAGSTNMVRAITVP